MKTNNYKFGSLLGSGGYGKVYECNDNKGNKMAVKCIPMDKNGLKCLSEAGVLTTIQHKHLVSAKDVIVKNNKLCFIMDKAKSDLNKWTRRNKLNKTPTPEVLRQWTFAIISGLAALHQQNIIHCDLKASNILLFDDNLIKISDFNLALFQTKNKTYQHNIGTATHRAPEVWLGIPWSYKVDIWSLGCTLYEIAYGECLFPYQGGSTYSDKQVRRRYIRCINDWCNYGPLKSNNCPDLNQLNVKHGSFNKVELHKNFNLPINSLFNDFILQMLYWNPDKRPSISDLLSHPYMIGIQKIPFKIITVPDQHHNLSYSYLNQLTNSSLSPDILNFAISLYAKTTLFTSNLIISDLHKIAVCLLVSSKIISRQPYYLYGFTQSQILSLEFVLCHYLHFRLCPL